MSPVPPSVSDLPGSGSARQAQAHEGPDADASLGPDGLYVHAPSRGFLEAVSVCLRKYFTFSGRASRSEYWYFVLFAALVAGAASILDVAVFGAALDNEDSGPMATLTSLALFIPSLAVAVRRLHDIDRTAWWIGGFWLAFPLSFVIIVAILLAGGMPQMFLVLLSIGTLIYSLLMLVFMCTRGTHGPNRFG